MLKGTFTLSRRGYSARINELACQADGSVLFQQGGTVLLAAVVSAPATEFPGFFPLGVEYREPFCSAGKIPGGFFKREGKLSDKEVLTSRIIDRAIRPLFPKDYFHAVQVTVTVYSVDKTHTPHALATIATSLALMNSKIPFMGPVGIAEIGRLGGKWIIDPTYEQGLESDVKITVVGTKDGICMVEGATNEISEKEFVEALFLAHDAIKEQVAWQEEIIAQASVEKETSGFAEHWGVWEQKAKQFFAGDVIAPLFGKDKIGRNEVMNQVKEQFFAQHAADMADTIKPIVEYIFDEQLKERVTEIICEQAKRIDGRSYDQVRPIAVEVGLLPFTHGSSLFTRGGTQSLATLTLGSGQDEQKIEDIMGGEVDGSFMLHYNFPPFCVGEARGSRPPSRRDIGHGHLAASSFRYVLPDKESFPYTIRIVSDILESDGSSSMATVCSSTLAFLNGGVPIKDMVGGVAMGLLKSSKSDFTVLTDINGFEDAFGLMDFKVAGTENGITAIQMDIKYKGGLGREVFEKALAQARVGRIYILGEMKKIISKPGELSALVPQVVTLKVNVDKIGAIIGSGGKVIREIIEKTGVASIDIEDDGLVKIFGQPGDGITMATLWVKTLAGIIERGEVFQGVVRRIAEFGIFVELVPGKDGLLHISAIPREQQRNVADKYPIGSVLKVAVVEYDQEQDRVRLKLAE